VRFRTKLLLPLIAVSAIMTVASLAVVRHTVDVRLQQELGESLSASARNFADLQRQRESSAEHAAEMIASLPSIKAMMTTQDPATIQDASTDVWSRSGVQLMALADRNGKLMATHTSATDIERAAAQSLFLRTDEKPGTFAGERRWWFAGGRLYQVFFKPVDSGAAGQNIFLGTLALGYEVDHKTAAGIAQAANGEVAFRYGGNIVLSTLGDRRQAELASQPAYRLDRLLQAQVPLTLDSEKFLARSVVLSSPPEGDLQLVLLESWDRATAFLNQLNARIAAVGAISILLGAALVFAISLGFTRPLEQLITGVRALATGDFSYPLQNSGRDEIAELTNSFDNMRRNLKSSQERQVTSARLEAVGQLAGGVAHDFNNLVTIINGYSDLMLSSLKHDEKTLSYVQQIKKAGDRASSLTRQLLAFSRKQVSEPQVIDLNQTVSNMGKMLKMLIGEHIELEVKPATGLRKVFADPGHVEQGLLNLVVNARDAMPDGGSIGVETGNVGLAQPLASIEGEIPAGNYVALRVTDTGCGMDEQTQRQIFQPFFTTKPAGKGTGLGLAIVYGVVKQSGGFIQLSSEPGKGSTFTLLFPEAADQQGLPRTVASSRAMASGGSETILVVEDEEGLRTMVRESLQMSGYKVLEAQHGEEAMQVLGRRPDVHLVLTDVIMPRMGGLQLAEKIRATLPKIKVLFMSGYTDRWAEIEQMQVPLLHKPFTPESLARKVREVLSGGSTVAVQ
jgi:two-component system cell cycle sensor histidine kinase/response regulator CckA